MCLGVPMQVQSVSGLAADCVPHGGEGERRTVSLALVGPVEPGAHVLVHITSAVRVLDPAEAALIAGALSAVAAAAEGAPFEHLIADLIDREPELPAHLRPDPPAPQPGVGVQLESAPRESHDRSSSFDRAPLP